LGVAIGQGKRIQSADNDINYTLKLQNERLAEKGVEFEYKAYHRENGNNRYLAGQQWNDIHYDNKVCFRQCGVKRVVKISGKRMYKDDRRSILYQTITDVKNGEHPDNDPFSCPNCGEISTIAELQNGCKYCGTTYKMDDLFPKVTGFYFLDDNGLAKNEGFLGMAVSMLTCTALLFLACFIARPDVFNPLLLHKNLPTLIGYCIGMPFFGVITGYFTFSIFLLIRLIARGVATSSKMGTAGSRHKFEVRMKKITPEFSYEYFTSKAISLIKTAIYSKNEEELLFYTGPKLDANFKDIIDLNYGGALGLDQFKDEGNIVTVVTDAFFDVLYVKGRKVSYRHQVFEATFQRRTDIPVNMNFSMTRIKCPSCGSSFDAMKNKYCPYCGKEYELISDDWVLTGLRLK
jgi:predicted RNA-binding Zn-ribbon protein involved in translation (DUF1610 family)